MWVKVDDGLPEHRKVFLAAQQLGPASSGRVLAMLLEGLCWANRHATDGYLPTEAVRSFRHDRTPLKVAEALAHESVRLWEPCAGGWQIHDYGDYQPTSDKRRQVSSARSEAGRLGGQRSAEQRGKQTRSKLLNHESSKTGSNGRNQSSNGEANGQPRYPVPVASQIEATPPYSPPKGDRFEEFWLIYPRKVGKQAAKRVWDRLKVSEAFADLIIAAVERQSHQPQWTRDGGQFVPHPATWLHQGRWDDEVEAVSGRDRSGVRASSERPAWNCPHDPHCGAQTPCELLQDLAAAKAAEKAMAPV